MDVSIHYHIYQAASIFRWKYKLVLRILNDAMEVWWVLLFRRMGVQIYVNEVGQLFQ